MKISKFKALAASTALALSLLGNGCYVKFEVKEQTKYSDSIKKKNETIAKYKRLVEMTVKYDKLVPGKDYAEERIVIGFDKGTTKQEANKFIEKEDIADCLEMLSYFSDIEVAVVKVPREQEKSYALYFQSLSDETIVEHADLDYIVRPL